MCFVACRAAVSVHKFGDRGYGDRVVGQTAKYWHFVCFNLCVRTNTNDMHATLCDVKCLAALDLSLHICEG